MSKLRSVLGFRPTPEEVQAIEEAERATGQTRSDILRKCFEVSLTVVVNAMMAERAAHGLLFNEVAKKLPHQPVAASVTASLVVPASYLTHKKRKPK